MKSKDELSMTEDEAIRSFYEKYAKKLSDIPDTEKTMRSMNDSDRHDRRLRMAKINSDAYLLADIKKMIEES